MKDMLNSLSKLQFKFESILNWNKFKAVMINYKKKIILQLQPYWNEVGTIYIYNISERALHKDCMNQVSFSDFGEDLGCSKDE
jgi:hypothetical protein